MLEKGITYLMTRLSLVSISNVQDVQISGNWLEKSRIGINIWKKFPVKIVVDPGIKTLNNYFTRIYLTKAK